MAEYEEKFIVLNKKRLEELNECTPQDMNDLIVRDNPSVMVLKQAIQNFKEAYEADCGKLLNQKYYVVNQDEPYADNVIKFILDNENKKEKECEENNT